MKCSVMECVEDRTLYNVNFALQNAGVKTEAKWCCVYHLPKELTYVVGLRAAEDLKKAGRD